MREPGYDDGQESVLREVFDGIMRYAPHDSVDVECVDGWWTVTVVRGGVRLGSLHGLHAHVVHVITETVGHHPKISLVIV